MADNKIDLIKNTLDIVEVVQEYVDLTKKGKNYWGICPFHDDSNPSMSVSSEKQMYNCFSCGKAGGIYKFVQDIEKISFKDALKKLGDKAGVEIKLKHVVPKYNERQIKLIAALNDAMDYYQASMDSEEAVKALEYANDRGLDPIIREKFKIGYAPKDGLVKYLTKIRKHDESDLINSSIMNSIGKDFLKDRLIFGISNGYGDIVAMSGRTINNEESKYINSGESLVFKKSKILYNWNNAKESAKKNKEIILVEGFMDVISLHKAGVFNSVAIMGTALNKENIDKLSGLNVVLMLDSDQAGISATIKSIKLLLENGFNTYVVQNSTGKDPDELFNSEGEKGINKVLSERSTGLEFIYEIHKRKYDITKLEQISKFVESFKKYLLFSTPIERDFFAHKMYKELGVSKQISMKGIYPKNKHTYTPKPKYIPVPKEIELKKEKVNFNKSSYKLIRSILKSKPLSKYYDKKRNGINFIDKILGTIGAYIINAHKGIEKIPKEYLVYIKETIKLDGEVINTPEEMEQLIMNINMNYKMFKKKQNKVKLENKGGNNG